MLLSDRVLLERPQRITCGLHVHSASAFLIPHGYSWYALASSVASRTRGSFSDAPAAVGYIKKALSTRREAGGSIKFALS